MGCLRGELLKGELIERSTVREVNYLGVNNEKIELLLITYQGVYVYV